MISNWNSGSSSQSNSNWICKLQLSFGDLIWRMQFRLSRNSDRVVQTQLEPCSSSTNSKRIVSNPKWVWPNSNLFDLTQKLALFGFRELKLSCVKLKLSWHHRTQTQIEPTRTQINFLKLKSNRSPQCFECFRRFTFWCYPEGQCIRKCWITNIST